MSSESIGASKVKLFQQGTYAPAGTSAPAPGTVSDGWPARRWTRPATSASAIPTATRRTSWASAFAARRAGDPPGQLTTREAILVHGEAAQTSTVRWQDYTQTAVDPTDDCTIWYVGDYLKKDASSYSSRIGAFRIPGCTP
jgi:hypothetical protein